MQHSDKQKRLRIFFTGVGGQGTLTATTLLARTALAVSYTHLTLPTTPYV